VPDLPGHGASGQLSRQVRETDFADDTAALLAHLQIGKADFVGLSLGGIVALELALERPELVDKLVLANSFDAIRPELRQMLRQLASQLREADSPADLLEQGWADTVNESFRNSSDGRQTYQVWHGVDAAAHGPSIAYVAEGITNFNVTSRLSSLRHDVLIIAGERDMLSPPAISRGMADAIPNARYVELAGASHVSNGDSSDEFTREILKFLLGTKTSAGSRAA
jgi:3-oxoadipate enol-lactonase